MLTLLWIPATVVASAAQTARNAMQRHLTGPLGTVGATQVRFLYGLPFGLLFLAAVLLVTGAAVPAMTTRSIAFTVIGAVSQILATGLMLAAMQDRSFAVTTAYTKTEPVQVALFGLAVLGDPMTPLGALGCLVATVGVGLMSWKPGSASQPGSWRSAALGIVAGSFFAVSAIGFRGGIVNLVDGSFLVRATTTLVLGLTIQTALIIAWMLLFDRPLLMKIFGAWRQSIFAGFMGAFASQCWFIAFALTNAANVRTLALIEVLFAQAMSKKVFAQDTSMREKAGMALIVAGVAILLWGVVG
ncbi:MAG: DMT family transporter [Hyphomicrobiaceae bacterium]